MDGKRWVQEEFESVELGDARLANRLRSITEALLAHPELPINGALCGEWAATKAAYRFFSNKKVTPHRVLLPHREKTIERIQKEEVVLAIQDTTYLNFNNHRACKGLGYIGTEALKGIIAHTTLCCTRDGIPLGIIEQKLYTRKEVKDETSPRIATLPIAMKESIRWLESIRMISTLDTGSAQLVSICDREGDITEFLAEADKLDIRYVVRSTYNRVLKDSETGGLHDVVRDTPIVGKIVIDVPQRGNQKRKKIGATVQYCQATVASKEKSCGVQSLTCIRVKSINPTDALEWLLITNINVTTFEQAIEKIRWYRLRWHIEQFHKILKSGCAIEDCRLGTFSRLASCITLYSIIAYRLLYLTLYHRLYPDAPALLILSKTELTTLTVLEKTLLNQTTKLTSISLAAAMRALAKLGGFLGRTHDREPGIITIWRGWNKLQVAAMPGT